ncbi:hypothetical protein WL95_24945 [Burkholderia cepacia]|nr:hypothetical protein WL95_24945 [Burkholderia cepacia]
MTAGRCPAHSDVPDLARIAGRVVRKQRNAFRDRLRDQETVKRISMDRRQLFDCKCVCARDRQFHVADIEEIATEHVWVHLEIVAIQATLDDDLPEARDAEKRCTGGILDERTGAGGQFGRTGCRPKKQGCIEQQLHASPSNPLADFNAPSPAPPPSSAS